MALLPRIRAVGTAVPERQFDQPTLADLLGYRDSLRRGFFLRSGIDTRHLYVTASDPRPDEDVDVLAARFQEASRSLGVTAVIACLDLAGLTVGDVDFLATTTCTGRLCPSLDAHLMRDLGFRPDAQRVHVGDTGCASAMVALQQGWNHVQAFPGHRALAVSVEVCSATYFVDDDAETAVANAIFADGAAAGEGEAHPVQVLGADQGPVADHRVRLSPDVRRIAPAMMEELADRLLKDHGLERSDIRLWVLHSAGRRVIEHAQATLGLTDHDVAEDMLP